MRVAPLLMALAGFASVPGQTQPTAAGRWTHPAAKPSTAIAKRAAVPARSAKTGAKPKAHASKSRTSPAASRKKATTRAAARKRRSPPRRQPVYADAALGDNVAGEELPVRRAAIEALGGHNGSVVVVDASTGRLLTVVNQKLAFRSGFTPCSTIKLVTALAALKEGVIERQTPVRLSRRLTLDLTTALAQSHLSNGYFGGLGQKVGFDRVRYYAQLFGLGEKAGWKIAEERAGIFPEQAPPTGVRLMTSFGTGISLTPLELAAFVAAVANGGTLYYLQYPRTRLEIESLVPRVKRELDFGPALDDLRIGMRAAVESGTARRAMSSYSEPMLGKTGTCTDFGQSARLGWFTAYNETGRRLAVVVLLTGSRAISGSVAAGVAGHFFHNVAEENVRSLAVAMDEDPLACCQ